MKSRFVISRKGVVEVYESYSLIPKDMDHLIEFSPFIPPPPHTTEQHEEIEGWFEKFKNLIELEKKNGSNRCSSTG